MRPIGSPSGLRGDSRPPLDRLERAHVGQEPHTASAYEYVAAEAVRDALHGEGAFTGIGQAAVAFAL